MPYDRKVIQITHNSTVCAASKKNTAKPQITGPLRGESSDDGWIPLINDQ